MPVGRVKRLHVIAHEAGRDELLRALHKLGCVHMEDMGETPPEDWEGLVQQVDVDARELDRRLLEIEGAIDYLTAHAPSSGFLGGGKLYLTGSQMQELADSVDVEAVVAKCRKLEQRETERKASEAHLRMIEEHLEPWRSLSVPVDEILPTERTDVAAGSVSESGFAVLEQTLSDDPDVYWEVVSRHAGEVYLVLIWHRDAGERISSALKEVGFVAPGFHGVKGKPADVLAEARRELVRLAQEREADSEAAQSLALHRPALMVASDRVRHELDRMNAAERLVKTGSTVVLRGWARERDVARIESAVGEDAAVIAADPGAAEDVPVELDNRPVVKPFQVVTRLYGLPRYREVDPTPFLAPFFAVSFGLALGEGGYGVLMALISFLGLRYLKLSSSMRQLLRLLFLCGVCTFVAGILMGSFFAVDFQNVPPWLGWAAAIHGKLKLLDPLQDSMTFLFIVLGIGLVQVWVGVLIKAVDRFRSGQRALALLHEGAWLVALALAPLAIAKVPLLGMNPMLILAAAGASIFVTAGAGSRGVGARIGAGLFALYGAVGFFGDILSYSRLFALGLATGVVAMVVNILAGMVRGIPLVGWAIMLVLLVFGHMFNLAINALGAFIHTARLQFVEFFTKFFEGGGKSFLPFREEGKYTELAESEGG
jgi:V/A-type H+-transporting ATPase subunit I